MNIDGYKFYRRGWRNGHYYEEWIADDYDEEEPDREAWRRAEEEDSCYYPPEYDGDDD